MIVAYIAGPYRASTPWELERNVRVAEALALEVAERGGGKVIPLCPHSMYRFFDRTLTDEFWIGGTLELLRRCDLLVVTPNWRGSQGTLGEVMLAREMGIPIVFDVEELEATLRVIENEADHGPQ